MNVEGNIHMPKIKEFPIDESSKSFELTTTHCVICDDVSVTFSNEAYLNICTKCKEILDAGNCLVVELLYQEDNKLVGGRCIIVPKASMNTVKSIVCMTPENFERLYEQYKVNNN